MMLKNQHAMSLRLASVLACALTAISLSSYGTRAGAQQKPLPIEYYRLGNGLRVVLAPDATAPLARMGVYYGVGSVHEVPGRAGFAHLFEHFMFEGSARLKPGEYFELVVANGGRFGARTLYDFTKYNTTVPKNALELMLWAEADRMRNLLFDTARFEVVRSVVKNEVRQNAFDRPYGRFVWIDLREAAFSHWQNAHSIYGDTPDGKMAALDASTLQDARDFFRRHYSPDNAVLVVHGDIEPAATLGTIRKYFSDIPRRQSTRAAAPPEPLRTQEKRETRIDPNITRPALAVGYHMPPRTSPDFWTMVIVNHLLAGGRHGWLQHALVTQRGLTDAVYAGVSARHGTAYTVGGASLWTAYMYHDTRQHADTLLAVFDAQIERLQAAPVDNATLQRAIMLARAEFYGEWEAGRGDGRTDLLAQFALFDDDPTRINRLDAEFRAITQSRVLSAARKYLQPSNRVVLTLRTRDAVQ